MLILRSIFFIIKRQRTDRAEVFFGNCACFRLPFQQPSILANWNVNLSRRWRQFNCWSHAAERVVCVHSLARHEFLNWWFCATEMFAIPIGTWIDKAILKINYKSYKLAMAEGLLKTIRGNKLRCSAYMWTNFKINHFIFISFLFLTREPKFLSTGVSDLFLCSK